MKEQLTLPTSPIKFYKMHDGMPMFTIKTAIAAAAGNITPMYIDYDTGAVHYIDCEAAPDFRSAEDALSEWRARVLEWANTKNETYLEEEEEPEDDGI